MARLAESHPNLSFRGACFCILDLIARSEAGRRELAHVGWATGGGILRGTEYYMPIAIPQDISFMLKLTPLEYQGAPVDYANEGLVAHTPTASAHNLPGGGGGGPPLTPSGLDTISFPSLTPPTSINPEAAAPPPVTDKTSLPGGEVVLGGEVPPQQSAEEEIMDLIVKLSNYVTRREAQLQLTRLRKKAR